MRHNYSTKLITLTIKSRFADIFNKKFSGSTSKGNWNQDEMGVDYIVAHNVDSGGQVWDYEDLQGREVQGPARIFVRQ